jgi:PPOX class probable F420-dependent enzyme
VLEREIKELATGRNFAAFTTLGRDGMPSNHIMWVDADDEYILINTETHRAKFRNVERDPRVSVVIWNDENAYEYGEVRGVVEETVGGPEAREHIDALSHKYFGKPYATPIQSQRVILKIRPRRQLVRKPRG